MHKMCIVNFLGVGVIIGLLIFLVIKKSHGSCTPCKECPKKLLGGTIPTLISLGNAQKTGNVISLGGSDYAGYNLEIKDTNNLPYILENINISTLFRITNVAPASTHLTGKLLPEKDQPAISFDDGKYILYRTNGAKGTPDQLNLINALKDGKLVYMFRIGA